MATLWWVMDVSSTAAVPAGERFGFWCEVIRGGTMCVPSDVLCDPRLRSGFRAQVGIRSLGSMSVSLLTTTPHSVRRTSKLIRQADSEELSVCCSVHGHAMVEQDGRRADFGVGDLAMYDSSRPFLAGLVPNVAVSRLLVLRFPRSMLPMPPQDLRRLTAVRIRGDRGIGALSSQFLLQLARQMDQLTAPDAARLSTLTLDVLTATLAGALDAQGTVPPETRRRALLAEIHAFIRANLGDPRLTPSAIAEAHHISLRYLHKLFQAEGHTVAGWIRARRLEQCRRDLAEPWLATRPINAIAARWGFPNPKHFSQAFRAAYDLSPRQFRQQHARARTG
jgi:AraC-like DNA-binding protein